MGRDDPKTLEPKTKTFAQVLICKKCCAKRAERIKATWKEEKLKKAAYLTLVDCLGPCNLPTVALLIAGDGATWYGRIETDAQCEALIDWARACREIGDAAPAPAALAGHRFDRFAD